MSVAISTSTRKSGVVWVFGSRAKVGSQLGTIDTWGSLQGAQEGGAESQCPKKDFVPVY